MKKTLLLALISLVFVSIASAQPHIRQRDLYIGARVSEINLSISSGTTFAMGFEGGFFIADRVSIGAIFDLKTQSGSAGVTTVKFLGDVGFHFLESKSGAAFGLFGAGVKSVTHGDTSFLIELRGGYSLFITDNIAFEPSIGFEIPFAKGYDAVFNLGAGFSVYF